jgi:hypothetical protein
MTLWEAILLAGYLFGYVGALWAMIQYSKRKYAEDPTKRNIGCAIGVLFALLYPFLAMVILGFRTCEILDDR